MSASRSELSDAVERAYLSKESTGLVKHGKLKAKIVPVSIAEIEEYAYNEKKSN